MLRLRKGEKHFFISVNSYSVIQKFAFRWASQLKFADFTSHVFSFTKWQFLQVYLLRQTGKKVSTVLSYSDWVCTAVMSNDVMNDLRG